MRDARNQARLAPGLLDDLEESVADLGFERVPDELDGIELLADRLLALREPPDARAERDTDRVRTTALFDLVEPLEDVRVDLLDVRVV